MRPFRSPARALTAALVSLSLATGLSGEEPSPGVASVRSYRTTHAVEIVDELSSFLRIPNLASDPDGVEANVRYLRTALERRGLAVSLLEVPGSPPVVLGELEVPGAERTVVFYAHYDGQPVVPEQWASAPWSPVLRDGRLEDGAAEVPWPPPDGTLDPEWRLYARSASDDKAPIVALLAALDALSATGRRPSVNVKLFLEGEEEAGSPHLEEVLERYRDRLDADLWLFCDGPVHQSRRSQAVFGVRGTQGVELTLFGPTRPLHSGHYGNWAPNPGALAAELITSLRDPDGHIRVEGFYDDVRETTAAERAAIARVPPVEPGLRHELLIAESEGGDTPLMERLLLPALNVRGIEVGRTGAQARNLISSEAHVSLGFRLVPDQSPELLRERVEAQLASLGWTVVHEPPSPEILRSRPRVVLAEWDLGGYPSFRTPLDLPVSRTVVAAMSAGRGEEVLEVPTLGGSLPLYLFDRILDVPLIVTPIVNHDNNQHGHDENLRLANLWQGIDVYAALLLRLGEGW